SLCFFSSYAAPQDLHSFPTRRSSDLRQSKRRSARIPETRCRRRRRRRLSDAVGACAWHRNSVNTRSARKRHRGSGCRCGGSQGRSEEHTSELQSLRHLVCRLLLEKKK